MNAKLNKETKFFDLGTRDYKETWDYQVELFTDILGIKAGNREIAEINQRKTPNFFLLVEHPHVYTLGKSGKPDHLLIDEEKLDELHATYYPINRGGDITYHGPGQLVGYPILDLENFFTDIHRYMRSLEEVIINTLDDFGLKSGRIKGLTGVWIDAHSEQSARKICAFGVKTSRWVTQHGFALNVDPNLDYFNHIIPCGINRAVTSMTKELGRSVPMADVKDRICKHLAQTFDLILI